MAEHSEPFEFPLDSSFAAGMRRAVEAAHLLDAALRPLNPQTWEGDQA